MSQPFLIFNLFIWFYGKNKKKKGFNNNDVKSIHVKND